MFTVRLRGGGEQSGSARVSLLDSRKIVHRLASAVLFSLQICDFTCVDGSCITSDVYMFTYILTLEFLKNAFPPPELSRTVKREWKWKKTASSSP